MVNGSTLEVFGFIMVNVILNSKKVKLELIIINTKHKFVPLTGRDWLDVFCDGWRQIFTKALCVNNLVLNNDKKNGERFES